MNEGAGWWLGVWVQGSGPVCVARRAVKVRGRPTFRECRANKTEDSSWRLEDKEKREESFENERVLNCIKSS